LPTGTFPGDSIQYGLKPGIVAQGDFNGDGKLDLVVVSGVGVLIDGEDADLTVLLGNGDGTFQTAETTPLGDGNFPAALATGDFDRNGSLDLAVSFYLPLSVSYNALDRVSDVAILLNNGHGIFGAPSFYSVGDSPQTLVTGEFNGDGFLDLATSDYFEGDVAVLLGKGNGTFAKSQSFGTGVDPVSLAAGDFKGDGRVDLVTLQDDEPLTQTVSGRVILLTGNGDGTFHAPGTVPLRTAGMGTYGVVTGDFNRDGRLDVVTVNNISDDLSVLLGNGDGTFQAARTISLGAGTQPNAVATGDFNGDGRLDLVFPTRMGPSRYCWATEMGRFRSPIRSPRTCRTTTRMRGSWATLMATATLMWPCSSRTTKT
jgi:hypothetical protein